MSTETKNAKITSVRLGYEDHGVLTAYLQLDYGGLCQSFGGYAMDRYSKEQEKRVPTEYCGWFIARILEVVGVDSWEKLPGQYIRVETEWTKVHAIGNILKDIWFNPSEEFKEQA